MKSNTAGKVEFAWRGISLKTQHPRIAAEIASEFKLNPVTARVLAARGFKADEQLKHFINPTLREGLADPLNLKGMREACDLIREVTNAGGAVAICCDFDVDGLSGGAQLHHFFSAIGVKSRVFVPDRFVDGYGLNDKMVQQAAQDGFALLVTVDFGTRNSRELELARSLGLKTLVVDHHHVGDLVPTCDVFINPQQKGCGFAGGVLCAAGLVWYLLTGLKKALRAAADVDPRSYLDLACLGTICDMVPLIGANRVIAKRGLERLAATKRAGLRALMNVAGLGQKASSYDVSFGIGPRLNAAGRMVHGEIVVDLLTTTDTDRAGRLARQLHKLNLERQDTEGRIKEQAIEQVKAKGHLPAGLVVWDRDFHVGVIGIVAQRLVESFYRPSAVMGLDTDGVYKGSVRGIRNFSVVAALEAVGDKLIKFGGHEAAGGFSVSEANLDDFAAAFIAECESQLKDAETTAYAEADTEVGISDLSMDLIKEFTEFAPYGMGNPGPTVMIRDLTVKDVNVLKGAHLKAILSDGKNNISGLMWRTVSHPALSRGAKVSIVCRPDYNTWRGQSELQANLLAVE